MIKKLTVAILFTMVVLAFPVRLLTESPVIEAILKVAKAIVFISVFFLLMKRENFLRKQTLLRKIPGNLFITLLPVVVVIALYILYFFNKNIKDYEGTPLLLVLGLFGTFLAASGEEIVFRGYIFNLLKKNKFSFLKSLLLSSVFFSLIHIVNSFRLDDAWAIFNQLCFAFALGLLLGSVYALTNNLLIVCIFHFLINIPTSITKISETPEYDTALPNATLAENLLSTLFFIGLMLPVLLLSYYYIQRVNKKGVEKFEEDQLSAVK